MPFPSFFRLLLVGVLAVAVAFVKQVLRRIRPAPARLFTPPPRQHASTSPTSMASRCGSQPAVFLSFTWPVTWGRLAYGDVTAPALTDTCGAYATVQSSSAGASLGNDSTKVHSICRSRVGIVLYLFSSPAPTDSHAPPRNQNQSETRRPFLP